MIINRLIYALLIFFVPTIVSALMTLLSNVGVSSNEYEACLNVNKDIIEAYQKQQDIEEENEKKHSSSSGNFDKGEKGNNTSTNIKDNTTDKLVKEPTGTESTENIYKSLAKEMIKIASNEVGYKEGANDSNKYGKELENNNVPWCGLFVTWVAKHTTIGNTNLYSDVFEKELKIDNYSSATNSIYTFSESSNLNFYYSEYYGGNYTPKAGDIIYFNWNNNWNKKIYKGMHISPGGHVGIVEYVSDGKVHTIEGNYDGGVGKGSYLLNNNSIMGYGSWYK